MFTSSPEFFLEVTKPTLHEAILPWAGDGGGNITFDDSLDFEMSEIESVYEAIGEGE